MQTRKRKLTDGQDDAWKLEGLEWKATESPRKAWRYYNAKRQCSSRREWREACVETITEPELKQSIRFPSSAYRISLQLASHSRSITVANPTTTGQILETIRRAVKKSDDADHIYLEGIFQKNGRYIVGFGS